MENSARFFEAYWPNMLEDMQAWMRIPSVSREAEGPYPFGRACGEALDAALALGRAMGFDTENDDYTGGSILFRGTQAGEIGMFAHLDVVPEGEGWLHPPYSPYISDGWLYGRGSADDKGPAVVALYAMYCLKQMGYVPCRTIRLYLGCSEERGMRDIRAFLERHPAPDFSFTPDASFSVCYSEKGIIEAEFTAPLPEGIAEFKAGAAPNAVAGSADAVLACTGRPNPCPPQVSLCAEGGVLRASAQGRSAHAAFPEGSDNAAVKLAAYLRQSGLLNEEACRVLAWLAEDLSDPYGEALGIAFESKELGRLTSVAGMTRTRGGQLVQTLNIRYPAEANAEQIADQIRRRAEQRGWSLASLRDDPPSYISPEHPIVREMDRICRARIGDSVSLYTMGGGTYARHLPNAVGYGPAIRGLKKPGPDGHGGGHQPDECVSLKVLEDAFFIYVQALQAIDALLNRPDVE